MRIMRLLFILFVISIALLSNGCISAAVYQRLAVKPDKVTQEFKYAGGNYQKIIDGDYLGKISISGKEYYHLQFSNVLKGDERCIHIYLECRNSEITSGNDLNGFLVEEKIIESSLAKKSLMFYHYIPNDKNDKKGILYAVSKKSFNENEMEEYPTYVSGWANSQGNFICYPPYEWGNIDPWYCTVDISRVERSNIMPFIRPLYAVPAAIIFIPVDIIFTLYSIGETIISPRHTPTHVDIAERISGRGSNY
jgi:hypothetical protein